MVNGWNIKANAKYCSKSCWKKGNKDKVSSYNKKQHQRDKLVNTVKWKARWRDYKLRKPNCERCNSTTKLQFHHTDYEKHLGITLCIPCHIKEHKSEGKK